MFNSNSHNNLITKRDLTTQENSTVYRIFKSQNLIQQNIDELTNILDNLKVDSNNQIEPNFFNQIEQKNLNQSIMSLNGEHDNCVNDVFKSLRIPDAIKDLPKYEGSRHTLYEFIENVEEILTLCNVIDGHPCSKIFLRAIRNKIVGEANEVLTMYGTPLEWEAIKDNLVTHYADKRNETNLVRDLYSINQGNDTIEKYFSRIIDIQSTIVNHIKLNETSTIIIRAKNELYQEMCLNTFLAGLKEPLGSMIRAMQPRSLTEAFASYLKEQNMAYLKKGTNVNAIFIPQRPIPPKLGNPSRNNYPSYPILQPKNPHHQYNYRPTPQYYNHRPFTNQNPNLNGNRPMNLNHNRFAFKPPMVQPTNPSRKYEPMDTTSNADKYKQYTNFKKPNQFQPTGSPRFQAQEIYTIENPEEEIVTECYEEEPQNYFPDLEEGEVDDENFHHGASHQESDT